MKKLKTKIFITIFMILTVSILIILFLSNSTNYLREKNNIEENLTKMIDDKRKDDKAPPEKPDGLDDSNNPKRFMDVSIYTVLLSDGKIDRIISHTKDGTTPNEIKNEAEKIINKGKKDVVIGNLYFSQYSYHYQDNQIVIMDNSDVNTVLQFHLLLSILIFFVFEGISYVVCYKISKWIIEPVEDSFNKQKQFIADASHELKTPLSVIMASAEAMESDKDKKWLHNIQNEANRMSDLIKELLDLAKLENDNKKVVLEEHNLSKLVEMAVLPLESLIYEKNIQFDYHIEEDIIFSCQTSEIKQLVTILMDNAIKHCKSRGHIFLELKRDNHMIVLNVQNEGKPIPKGEEEKIFERFYRVDQSRNRNDNRYGLGLAIAKGIVLNHHGKIRAYSSDRVTTFEVTFKK